MPQKIFEYRCLLISPDDVKDARDIASQVVNNWNAQIGQALNVRIELIKWESHSIPNMGDSPQQLINQQLIEDCDLGVALFWYRIGTPTINYESGSIEEIDFLIKRDKHVMIYFCTKPIPQEGLLDDQFQRLKKMRNKFEEEGLLSTYSDLSDLKEKLLLHFTSIITKLIDKDKNILPILKNEQLLTASRPDIKVIVKSAIISDPFEGSKAILVIDIQNHSPIDVFINTISIKLKSRHFLFPKEDSITKRPQYKVTLKPGDNYSFHLTPDVFKYYSEEITNIVVTDSIGRMYLASEEECKRSIKFVLSKKETR